MTIRKCDFCGKELHTFDAASACSIISADPSVNRFRFDACRDCRAKVISLINEAMMEAKNNHEK